MDIVIINVICELFKLVFTRIIGAIMIYVLFFVLINIICGLFDFAFMTVICAIMLIVPCVILLGGLYIVNKIQYKTINKIMKGI